MTLNYTIYFVISCFFILSYNNVSVKITSIFKINIAGFKKNQTLFTIYKF